MPQVPINPYVFRDLRRPRTPRASSNPIAWLSFWWMFLRRIAQKERFLLHEFVIMPITFHLLLTPAAEIRWKALQIIKGVSPIVRNGKSFCFFEYGKQVS